MPKKVKRNEFKEKAEELQQQFIDFFQLKKDIKPQRESFKISITYVIIGAVWILLSDSILSFFVQDTIIFAELQTYKGWFYVIISGVIFCFIINKRMMLFKDAMMRVLEGYEELNSTQEELIAMDEELNEQYNELKKT